MPSVQTQENTHTHTWCPHAFLWFPDIPPMIFLWFSYDFLDFSKGNPAFFCSFCDNLSILTTYHIKHPDHQTSQQDLAIFIIAPPSDSWENHKKIIGKHGIIIAFFGLFMGGMCLNNKFKGFLRLICSRLVQ